MNIERPIEANHQWADSTDELIVADAKRRRKRWLIIAGAALAVLVLAYVLLSGGSDEAPAAAAGGEGGGAGSAAVVSVIVPGREDVSRIISATGSLAARRPLPVGIAGEGGQIVRVLVEPGQWVRAGQTLAVIDRSVQTQQTRSLEAQVRVASADAQLAQAELDRARALLARGFVSKADIDRKTATRDAAAARVGVAQAQLAEARARNGRLDIRAPAAGLVLTRSAEPGQVVSAGSGVLFNIAQGGEMELLAQLSEDDLASVSPGVPATITPVGSDQRFTGQIWQVAPVIDPQTRQGTARIAIPYDRALRPGGFATAEIRSGSVSAPVLPESAVMSEGEQRYVYIVDRNNKVQRRSVTTGTVTRAGLTITSGLNGTERVVAYAGGFLNPGETVSPRVVRPGAGPGGGSSAGAAAGSGAAR